MDLADFMRARIAEDERVARCVSDERTATNYVPARQPVPSGGAWPHLDDVYVAVDPARALAECEAKRRITAMHADTAQFYGEDGEFCQQCSLWTREGLDDIHEPWPCETLRLLALPYADHPDFREEWRP